MADANAEALEESVRAVKQAPHAVHAWEELESLATDHDRPDDVAAAYRDVLATGVAADVAEMLGERAGGFCDTWFGDDPRVLEKILVRVLELAPQSESALQRLSVLYTGAERWNDLLGLYDKALDATRDKARRVRLLREAAQLAKDVANQADKAIGYLQRLLPLAPEDKQLAQNLERLLERHERWADLIALWESKLESQQRRDREKTRARIAGIWLDKLRDPARALTAIKPLLAEAENDAEACGLLEKVIESKDATRSVRENALDLLRAHYDSSNRPREVIRVLERVIQLDPAGSRGLREEAGARLAELDDDKAAMDHYAALLSLQPESSVTQEKLRQLAQRSSNFEAYAEGVATAGRASPGVVRRVELLAEAARTKLDLLDDPSGAIDLYQEALAQEGAGEREQLLVCRRLSELYSRVDRQRERLDVLEKLGQLEKGDANRRAVVGEAARLAESLGYTDRALALWQRQIDSDPGDVPALDARITLLEAASKWDDLVAALELRAGKNVSGPQKRSDLMRIATVHRQHRNDLDGAIAAWQRVARESGEDAESVSALSELLAETNRWKDMADLLERASSRDTERTLARLGRLGDALRQHLSSPPRALAAYRNAMAIDSTDKTARAGLTALLDDPATRAAAADILADAFRRNRDHAGVLELLPARLADAADDRTRLALLREAATIRLEHADDAAGALADLARAFPLAPRDGLIEDQIRRLAERTGDWATASQAFGAAIAALGNAPREAARLQAIHGEILADKLGDTAAGLAAYNAAAHGEPSDRRAVGAVIDLAPKHAQWNEAARALVAHFAARERTDDDLIAAIENGAQAAGAVNPWVDALSSAVGGQVLPPAVAAHLHHRLAVLHRDHRKDSFAAIGELRKALELGGERATWLADLVELERAKGPGRALLDALGRLAAADARDLDALVESADVASKLGDRDAAVTILGQVLGRATTAWRGTTQVKSSRAPDAVARWAVDGLVDLQRTGGNARAAVDTLIEAARLPFDDGTKRALRMRAADIATNDLLDNAAAIDMCRSALAAAPDDLDLLDRLGKLLEAEHRVPELLALRQTQLGLEHDLEKRLALRLEVAHLVGVVEERGGRLEALRQNLKDRPGHEASVDALAQILADKGQHKAVADLLEEQAQKLEAEGEPQRASRLWSRFAQVTERDTREIDRAILGHRRVSGLSPTPDSLRALARLNLERGQPAQAVPWFENLLAATTGAERQAVLLQLARAHLGAHQPDRAVAAIESHLDDSADLELRIMLADLYRQNEQWEPLARHLTRSLPMLKAKDDKLVGQFAQEASEIYTHKLDMPGKAVPALETALALDPSNKDMRGQLAEGLRVAGRLPEARKLLGELIADFGRRRTPERAALHVQLARVAQAEGKLDEALTEMEQASKMDASNARIQKELAEMARGGGQLDKAERTYRALLLVVRRQPPADDETAVGQSEVLYELHRIATARGEDVQAKELLESAIDAAVQSDAEVRRMRRSVLAHEQLETMLDVIDRRLKLASEAASVAKMQTDKADVLDRLGRADDAVDAMVKALQAMPGKVDLHDRTRALARKAGQTSRYVDAVNAVIDRLRRKDDPPLVADLLMRAGDALEHDAKDLPGAAGLYRRVEMMGERLGETFYAQARVAGALGDTDEQARALDKMLQLAGTDDTNATAAQIDALYRLAEIFLATPSRRAQGVDLLERAFNAEPRWAQAGKVLRAAAAAGITDPRVMALYERVARNGGDGELLLDFLERRAGSDAATSAQIREAVEVAVDIGAHDRAETLLERAVASARSSPEGIGGSTWAVLALAERRAAAGDLTAARDLVYEAAAVVDTRDVDVLAHRIAQRAIEAGNDELAAGIYEFLRERTPTDKTVWQPLLDLYRKLGDGDRASSVIGATLPTLTDIGERNTVRLDHARFLIDRLKRLHDALDILRAALADDPDQLEAAAMLEGTLRDLGDDEGMAEFLWTRFEDAQRRGNRASTVDVATRLGALLDATGSPDAGRVFRSALLIAPEDREILRQVVTHLEPDADPRDAAMLMERLLAVEVADRVPALASQLATVWEQAGDRAGVQRTLELAHRSAPDDGPIHDRLEKWYRDHQQWLDLAELMSRDAERMKERGAAVDRLREAAAVYSGFLGQPLRAADVLRKARERAPDRPELATELAAALAAGGQVDAAQTAIGEALTDVTGKGRTDLLLLRASLRQQLGDDQTAVGDLKEAYGIDPTRTVDAYADGLERLRSRGETAGDYEAERSATLQLSQLLASHNAMERARAILVGWIEREPRDAEPLYILCDMDQSIEHWDGVLAAATRLAYITELEAQVAAAMRAADAATRAGHPADAVPVLELVHQSQPHASDIRSKLREAYEASQAYRELAGILFADAEHGQDVGERLANYRKAAELYLYHVGDAEAAAAPSQRALELSPDDHGTLMLYVDLLMGLGRVEEAGRTLEASIAAQKKRTPELAVLQQRMGRVSAQMGDRDGQLNWLKKAFDVDRKSGEIAAELAQLATEIGDYELALKPLRAITLMENPQPVTRPMALLWEAKIEHARGNRAKAELWAKKALREDPAFTEAQQFLDELGN
jgi:tetratricopeptide (TPR) repeat protein